MWFTLLLSLCLWIIELQYQIVPKQLLFLHLLPSRDYTNIPLNIWLCFFDLIWARTLYQRLCPSNYLIKNKAPNDKFSFYQMYKSKSPYFLYLPAIQLLNDEKHNQWLQINSRILRLIARAIENYWRIRMKYLIFLMPIRKLFTMNFLLLVYIKFWRWLFFLCI